MNAIALDAVPTGFDVAGLLPGVGAPFDGANALISLARGDAAGAALAAAAMVPGASVGATTRANGIIELRGALHEYAGE